MSHHVLSLLVEDKPGLLTRVAGRGTCLLVDPL